MTEKQNQDERLAAFEVSANVVEAEPVRVHKIRLSHYRFFSETVELDLKGQNLLIYGENGTGKSSLYCALKLLAGQGLSEIGQEGNIFTGNTPEIEFDFSTGQTLSLNPDSTELPLGFEFLKPLSVFVPLLDYKRLLRLHFSTDAVPEKINIFAMLRELFRDYPVAEGGYLGEVQDFFEYFNTLKNLVNGSLLTEINELIKIFDPHFTVNGFNFKTEMNPQGSPEPLVRIDIDYHENAVQRYHSFLNEARLSALAISIYLASIRHLLGTLPHNALRILVLDDVLISLDMGNRLLLLEILKSRFADFQIFFFTHDKELFELYRDKMKWERYEFYVDDSAHIPSAIVKQGNNEFERAKVFYASKDYDACALLLRKSFEKLLKHWIPIQEQRDRNCNDLDLAGLVQKAISKSAGKTKAIFQKLDSDRKHILNPLSHNDNRNIFSQELKTAIEDLEKLKAALTQP